LPLCSLFPCLTSSDLFLKMFNYYRYLNDSARRTEPPPETRIEKKRAFKVSDGQ
jgi:hypothetical protein